MFPLTAGTSLVRRRFTHHSLFRPPYRSAVHHILGVKLHVRHPRGRYGSQYRSGLDDAITSKRAPPRIRPGPKKGFGSTSEGHAHYMGTTALPVPWFEPQPRPMINQNQRLRTSPFLICRGPPTVRYSDRRGIGALGWWAALSNRDEAVEL
ncbi:hypothetical protein B0T20DRAFT_388635 [Sordaria brevicollis]|uniref:Uncharacterized protein n=1 Tax=Sordaria brevicollis TaxID=83679 RepID=A0AAE0UGJ3_SORBR|nr:hypothetical protein B0T20DRAFT_388635 [Sordaria brevicollis]